ncbi:MAG: N-acetylmuramoyl-L-alanine amidase [Acidimicrobiaceae bacterium]|nr:N-acetylmuramoyl-L-alanine amidase [Acidimicrobiaceae bacterium]
MVEASWELGDRTLYHRSPNLRGDDVAELQRALGRLGFDAGRVDGIFGPLTTRAVEDFQRNVGLPPDGICGYESVQALHRLGDRIAGGPSVAAVREEDRLRHGQPGLAGLRAVIGQFGGLGALVRAVASPLRTDGAIVITLDEPDESVQAATANRFGADVYLGLRASMDRSGVAYYATTGFESAGGHQLASLVHARLAALVAPMTDGPVGMRVPILRETRMPAVLCDVAPLHTVETAVPALASTFADSVAAWADGRGALEIST